MICQADYEDWLDEVSWAGENLTIKEIGGYRKIMKVKLAGGRHAVIKKSLTGQNVMKSVPDCGGDEFEKYVKLVGFRAEPNEELIIKILSNSVWKDHLIEKGYISIENDEMRFKKGGRFVVNIASGVKELVLVAITDPRKGKEFVIWSLVNPRSGNPWDGSYPTADKDYLTKNELEAITGVKQPVDNFVKGYRG